MEISKTIQEYNIKKNQTTKLYWIWRDKKRNIWFGRDYRVEPSFENGECICEYMFVEPAVCGEYEPTYGETSYCENFDNCKRKDCKGYKNYVDYVKALKDYNDAKQELKKYPWWIRFAAHFQRNK